MFAKVTVTNDTGVSATVLGPALINRVEIFANNGNKLIQTLYDQEMWLENSFHNPDLWAAWAPRIGSSTAYAVTGTAIGNGNTQVFHIPLFGVLAACKLHLAGLKGELLIRIHFNTTSINHLAGSLVNTDACV